MQTSGLMKKKLEDRLEVTKLDTFDKELSRVSVTIESRGILLARRILGVVWLLAGRRRSKDLG